MAVHQFRVFENFTILGLEAIIIFSTVILRVNASSKDYYCYCGAFLGQCKAHIASTLNTDHIFRAATGGKTAKTEVLPGFRKIECGGGISPDM